MPKYSKNQQKILELVKKHFDSGESLSVRILQGEMGFKSPRAISYYLSKLEKEGFIKKDEGGKVTYLKGLGESNIIHLPLMASVPCGQPFFDDDNNIERLVPVATEMLASHDYSNLFLVKAIGDSMEPKIENNSYIVARRNNSPDSGSIVVAATESGNTVKVFREYKDQYSLEPINKTYQPLVFDKNQSKKNLEIRGVVVGIFKPVG